MTAAVAAMPVPVRYWQQRLRCSIHVASSFCHVLFCAGAPPPQHPMRPTDNPWASVVFLICATCLGLSFSLLLRPDSTLLFSFIFCRNHCDCVFPLFRLGFALPEVMGPLACDIWGSSPLNSVLQ